MAIDYTIEGGGAVSPSRLLSETQRYAALLEMDDGVHLSATGLVAGKTWRYAGDPCETPPQAEFDLDCVGTIGRYSAPFEVMSRYEIDDDGTVPDPRIVYAVTTAHRTQLSAFLSFAAALAFSSLGSGEISGSGLDRRYACTELGDLLGEPANEPSGHRFQELARRLGCDGLPVA